MMLKHLHLGYLGYHRSANVEGVKHVNMVIGNLYTLYQILYCYCLSTHHIQSLCFDMFSIVYLHLSTLLLV